MSGLWMACEHPERPPDPYVTWHYDGCEGCTFKAMVQAHRYPDDPRVRWLNERMTG